MENVKTFLAEFAKERPVGTQGNAKRIVMLEEYLTKHGYTIESLPFDCMVWKKGSSAITIAEQMFSVEASPFSEPFCGSGKLVSAQTIEELRGIDCQDAILLLSDEITASPLSPKDYPFYYPDEHRDLITLLEQKSPAAIIAATGATPLNGKNPFPLFEDGNFLIPSANIDSPTFQSIRPLLSAGATAKLDIDSHKEPAHSRQIVASKKAGNAVGKIVLAAHMDTKYDTPGALDNAAGVAVLLEAAAAMVVTHYDIDIVPFNSEEYYGANGELAYLDQIGRENVVLMMNIDSPCHAGSKTAVSCYNFSGEMQAASDTVMENHQSIVKGDPWYAGDHAPFLFRGTPCMAVTSSDFFEGALEHTHTLNDTLATVDEKLVNVSARYVVDAVAAVLK